jgi:hypothetical protein
VKFKPLVTPAVYGVRPEHFTLAEDGVDAEIQVAPPHRVEPHPLSRMADKSRPLC